MASLGEETRASCRGPSNHNAVALILPHKAMLGFDGGAIGADIYCDRTGIHARTIADCAKMLDALKDPANGYYDPRDVFTTVPRSSVLSTPYAGAREGAAAPGALKGMRHRRHPRVDGLSEGLQDRGADRHGGGEGDQGGARRACSARRWWNRAIRSGRRDPDLEQMKIDFRKRAGAAGAGVHAGPAVPARARRQPVFKEFAAAIVPTEFMPGKVFGSGTMQPIDYCVALAEGRIAPPANLDLATIQQQELANTFRFHISQYLTRRAADWKAKGFTETLADWAALNARSKFWGDDQRAAFKNWEEVADPRNPLGGRQGVNERIMLRELLRRVDMMVILENKLDALVRLHTPWPPGLIGHAYQYDIASNLRAGVAQRAERRTDRGADPGGLRHDRLRSGVRAQRRRQALRVDAVRHSRPRSRRRVCRSRWCSAPSPARRTSC